MAAPLIKPFNKLSSSFLSSLTTDNEVGNGAVMKLLDLTDDCALAGCDRSNAPPTAAKKALEPRFLATLVQKEDIDLGVDGVI